MKKQNIFLPSLFTIFTLGIYGVYWLYRVRKGLILRTSNPKDIPPVSLLFLPFLISIIVIVMPTLFNPSMKAGFFMALSIIGFIIMLVGLVLVPLWWFYKFFMTVEKVTKQTEGIILYVIGLVLTIAGVGVFAMLMAQNDINKYLDLSATHPDNHHGNSAAQSHHPHSVS